MPATREAVERALGRKIGKLFVPNPSIAEYAIVLRFPDTKVIVSGEIDRALRKIGTSQGKILVIARDLTIEARRLVNNGGCDLVTSGEFGWTDDSYQDIRQNT